MSERPTNPTVNDNEVAEQRRTLLSFPALNDGSNSLSPNLDTTGELAAKNGQKEWKWIVDIIFIGLGMLVSIKRGAIEFAAIEFE